MIDRLTAHGTPPRCRSARAWPRDPAPPLLPRQAVAGITWAVAERALGVFTGEVGVARPSRSAPPCPLDPLRHKVIYQGDHDLGVAGIHDAIVTALGGVPRPHKSTLIPQASDPRHRKRRTQAVSPS